jgi:hypothetical protein
MAFTRFNYDECRTKKILQESTGPGRYMLNVPGPADTTQFFNDPHIRMQGWGGNLRKVENGAPIDINSDLLGINRPLSKYCSNNQFPNKIVKSKRIKCKTNDDSITEQSRATHPAWMYKDLEQNHRYILPLDPQENTEMNFQNNLSTRILEKDHYVSKVPQMLQQRGQPVGVYQSHNLPKPTLQQ